MISGYPRTRLGLWRDPWAVDGPNGASEASELRTGGRSRGSVIKVATPSKPGLFVPNIDLIGPFRESGRESRGRRNGVGTRMGAPVESPTKNPTRSSDKSNSASIERIEQETANSVESNPNPDGIDAQERADPRVRRETRSVVSDTVEPPISEEESDAIVDETITSGYVPDDLTDDDDVSEFFDSDDWDASSMLVAPEYQPRIVEFDENDLIFEYEDDAYEPLHSLIVEAPQYSRNIRINQWLATIEFRDEEIDKYITEQLNNLPSDSFRYLINWLSNRQWEYYELWKFIEFRGFYNQSKQFWVFLDWDPKFKYWKLLYNRYRLGLNASLQLVRNRIHLAGSEIIDDEWLADWQELSPSALYINDCLSFSNFALYRSGLSIAEDWQRRMDIGYDFESDAILFNKDGGMQVQSLSDDSQYEKRLPLSWFESNDGRLVP